MNWLILVIASTGRRSLRFGESVGAFRVVRARLCYVAPNGRRYTVHDLGRPRTSPHGSTFRGLLLWLAAYVDDGAPVPAAIFGFGHPADAWGYGDAMRTVRLAALRAVVLTPATREEDA